MFEGRYHERNHKLEPEVMWKTSAYIDINAWKAGIARRPEDYEWCSFAAAVKGDEKARRGYAFMYGSADDWDVIRDSHEKSMREAMNEILATREAERAEREAKGEPAPGRRANPPPSKADPGLDASRRFTLELGERQSGGRRANLGAPVRRTDEAGGASRGGRDQEPDSLQPVLPLADAGEGACRPNRPPAPELVASGI